MRKFLYILLFACITVCATAATVYTHTESDGNVSYSDTPLNNSKMLIVPEGNKTSLPFSTQAKPTATSSTSTLGTADKKSYTIFSITTPTDQTTFQNQREIPVVIQVEPKLQEGDKIQLFIDGNKYGNPAESTSLTTGQLDRGSHTLSAAIVDNNNVILKQTNTITIYVQYARLGVTNKP